MDFFKKIGDEIEGAFSSKKANTREVRAGYNSKPHAANNDSGYASRATSCIKGDVKMFSGCRDSQTSADVSNVASFGLPPVHPAEKAGGACTNALLSSVKKQPNTTFGDLLVSMQALLKQRQYTQVPQLSSSQQVNLKTERFTTMNPRPNGRNKSLLIGINYYGQQGELSGCVNDVRMMRDFVIHQGFDPSPQCMRVLTDDRSFGQAPPTSENIINGMRWLVQDVQPGDSLFFHYSGHGGQMPDDNGDEEDGFDETLIPSDYQQRGQIRDDLIYKLLVAPLPQGAHMLAVFDCCHSGTILDLPYMFAATDANCQAIQHGQVEAMPGNPFFNFDQALKIASEVGENIMRSLGGLFK